MPNSLATFSPAIVVLCSGLTAAPPSTDEVPTIVQSSPVVHEWDFPARGANFGESGSVWIPLMAPGAPQMNQKQFAECVSQIQRTQAHDEVDGQEFVVTSGGDGGIASGSNVIFTIGSVPVGVVIPVIAATQQVANYLSLAILTPTNINIKLQFQPLAAGIVATAAPRISSQPVSPSLASLINSGHSGSHLDDARFLPNPPAPYGSGPAANSRLRVFYSALQSNGNNRYTSEDRIFWTAANLRAAWVYTLPALSAFDGTITFTTSAGIFNNYVFDPSIVPFPAAGTSYQDWLIRATAITMGWLSTIQTNLVGDVAVFDLYRFRNDMLAENTNGIQPGPSSPTDFGYLTQEPSAFNSIFANVDCDDVTLAIELAIANATSYSDPHLGSFAPDYNPGGYRQFRTLLASSGPFVTINGQSAFVASNFGTPLAGFSAYGTAVRNQFGGSGIIDDAQLVPPPAMAQRTRYIDCNMPGYVTNGGYCFLIDYNPVFPGYYGRSVVRGLNLPDGEQILNFVTGLNGSTSDNSGSGVDMEVAVMDDTNAVTGFLLNPAPPFPLTTPFLMGGAAIPSGFTAFPTFFSPTELKVLDSIGWDAPQP
ncbi:MAG: hypothetical protein EXS17_00180 [Phycisphaerales bacterium]|nr:hypothetical protein [Phycisphaerales bacterium]